jgi:hypothetical protein
MEVSNVNLGIFLVMLPSVRKSPSFVKGILDLETFNKMLDYYHNPEYASLTLG